ncbi:MAG: hypothetical protein J6S96_05550 [Muribaculaceae bacterium]|nr:hypothetical protein [Muribaculaceae bacterium]
MKRYLLKLLTIIALFVLNIALLVWCVPIDNNSYLTAYNRKMDLLCSCPQPRIIFMGGSNLAFGLDSHMIQDSLHCNVVNMGLHGGIGIRFLIDDCQQQIKPGDIVMLQFEYGNFFSGGNGEPETMPQLMMVTGWKNLNSLNTRQIINVIIGLPRLAASNAKRLFKYCISGSFDTLDDHAVFQYVASGFNEIGDEVSHWHLPPQGIETSSTSTSTTINQDFMKWLDQAIKQYENRGASVILLPPVCPKSHFACCYHSNIEHALDSIGLHYIVPPQNMTIDDRYKYNGGYHVNRDGVTINTNRIINLLKSNDIISNN